MQDDRAAVVADARAAAKQARKASREAIEGARAEAKAAAVRARQGPVVTMPDPTGDLVVDTAANLDAVAAGFRERAKAEAKRFELVGDSEFWTCLCFQTRAQKEAFLSALDMLRHGDKYIDGRVVAKKLGIALPDADVPYNTSSKVDPAWVKFTN